MARVPLRLDSCRLMGGGVAIALFALVTSNAQAQTVDFAVTSAATVTLRTHGGLNVPQTGERKAASAQRGDESNPCDPPSAKVGEAKGSAIVTLPRQRNNAIEVSLSVTAEAAGGNTADCPGGPCVPPCASPLRRPTAAEADSEAVLTTTVSMKGPTGGEFWQLRFNAPRLSGRGAQLRVEIVDRNGVARRTGSSISASDPPFTFPADASASITIRVRLRVQVEDTGYAKQQADGTFAAQIQVEPAPQQQAAQEHGVERIVGGDEANPDDFLEVGALLKDGSMNCSGILLSPSRVLTAAHCVARSVPQRMQFVIGHEANAATAKPGRLANVISVDWPRGRPNDFGLTYEPKKGADIAVLKINPPIRKDVAPFADLYDGKNPLPLDKYQERFDDTFTFVGFGYSDIKRRSGTLGTKRFVQMKVRLVEDNWFQYGNGEQNTCRGDSGGASFMIVPGSQRLTGVVSWGDAECSDFGVNMRVDNAYRAWILDRMR
jgi:trypsin